MKILLIHSSYRADGNTSRVLDLFQKKLIIISKEQHVDLEIEKIPLAHSDLKMCRGCRICFDQGEEKCPLKDDLLIIRNKMLKADAYVFASPVYVEDVNGVMKNWIDRMAFHSHRPAFYGKKVYVLTTSGMGSSNHSLKTMNRAFHSWAMNGIGEMKLRLGALTVEKDIQAKYDQKILFAAKKLIQSVKNSFSEKPSFYSLIAFTVQQTYWQKNEKYEDTYDYHYWKKKKWLDKGCTYYGSHQSNALKTLFSKLLGKMVALFFV